MSDMTKIIEPKSDQVNSDDLMSGPRTIKVTKVSLTPGQEQPCSVHFEGGGGKPYKPCKSMARVMVLVWGADSKQYVGKSMTIYRDPDVKWAGMAVGGIRISHMSDMKSNGPLMLTVTRGKKAPYTVKPLAADVVPLKVVERAAESAPEAFDIAEFEGIVDLAIANMGADFPTWWDEQKPVRLQARDTDKARAGVIATKANEFIESLKGEC